MNRNAVSFLITALMCAVVVNVAAQTAQRDTVRRDTVVLEEAQVTTGYQVLPAERATGSFERVDEKLFNRQVSTDIISRLDGVMPSLLFDKRGGGNQLFVRGLSSIGLANNRPLIVVDNFPFEGDLDAINPNDVASVTLLKDAASASIWGARAGNGVLVITTKKGYFGQPFQFSATSNVTVQAKPDLFYRPQIAPADYIDNEIMLFERGVYDATLSNTRNFPAVTPAVDILDRQRRGLLSPAEANAQIDALKRNDLREQLTRHFYRQALMQQYALSLRGGTERVSTLLSGGYDRNLQNAIGNDFARATLRTATTFRVGNRLSLDASVAFSTLSRRANDASNVSMGIGSGMYPYASLVDENGQPSIVVRDRSWGYADTAGSGRLLDWHYRPYDELNLADELTRQTNTVINLSGQYQLDDYLRAEIRAQYENQTVATNNHQRESSYYVRDLINSFTQFQGDDVIRPVPLGGILDADRAQLMAYGLRIQANYQREWQGQHAVSVILGGEMRDSKTEASSSRMYGYDGDLLLSQGVDYANRYPRYTIPTSLAYIPYPESAAKYVTRFLSIYSNASYTFSGRYTASASMRKDASNLFGVETNDKWSPFWSAGLLWDLGKEPFYEWSAIPFAKVRMTYGHSGNVNHSSTAVTTLEYRGGATIGRLPYAIVSNPPNPSLRWEDVATWNFGIDAANAERTIGGSVEYFIKTASDLISSIVADPTTGFNSFSRNSAMLRNRGVDINLYGRHQVGQVSWHWDALFSSTRNKVLEYYYTPTTFSNSVGNGTFVSPYVGRSAYSIISYRFGGLDSEIGDPIGYFEGQPSKSYTDITQRATEKDVVLHGTALPTNFGALRNTLQWKNLSLSANLTFRFGYFFRRNTVFYNGFLTGNASFLHGDYYKRWQQKGDELHTNVPSMAFPGNASRDAFYRGSEATVERGDHIRLQDVNVTYAWSKRQSPWLPFREVRAMLYMRNIGMIWRSNEIGLDPDYLEVGPMKSIAFGLSVDF